MTVLEPIEIAEEVEHRKPHRTRTQTFVLVVAVVVLNALGNLLLTWGLRHVADSLGLNPVHYLRAMINPFVAAGIGMLILWLLTRMTLMSWADLSFVLPVTSIGYVFATLLGYFVLHEQVSVERWLGTLLIFAGAVLVGITTHHHTETRGAKLR